MDEYFAPHLPSIEHLRERARRRLPRFAFEYLEGGCNSEVDLRRNTDEIREVRLRPCYLRDYPGAELRTELFGTTYEAPFGVAPFDSFRLRGKKMRPRTEVFGSEPAILG